MATDVNTLINKIPAAERSAFKAKAEAIASRLGAPFTHLMAIMDLESAGTFDPAIKNPYGYVGLIQFGSAAAKDLGTTTDALRKMSRIQQLDYVEKYFNLWKKRLGVNKFKDFVDLYLAVFYPEGIKEQDPNKPFATPKVEAANPALRDSSGRITKNSIRAAYEKRYQGLFEKVVEYTKKNIGWVIAGLVLTGVLIFLAYQFLYKGKRSVSL
jgi:hypothetical protein